MYNKGVMMDKEQAIGKVTERLHANTAKWRDEFRESRPFTDDQFAEAIYNTDRSLVVEIKDNFKSGNFGFMFALADGGHDSALDVCIRDRLYTKLRMICSPPNWRMRALLFLEDNIGQKFTAHQIAKGVGFSDGDGGFYFFKYLAKLVKSGYISEATDTSNHTPTGFRTVFYATSKTIGDMEAGLLRCSLWPQDRKAAYTIKLTPLIAKEDARA